VHENESTYDDLIMMPNSTVNFNNTSPLLIELQSKPNTDFVQSCNLNMSGIEVLPEVEIIDNDNLIRLLARIGVRNKQTLTPRCKSLYADSLILQKKLRCETLKTKSFKQRLKAAEKTNSNFIHQSTD